YQRRANGGGVVSVATVVVSREGIEPSTHGLKVARSHAPRQTLPVGARAPRNPNPVRTGHARAATVRSVA
ncbi:MAG: hypothetical protein N2651_00740, partial [Fimbriimonadales bacterium]|nr:hypothetical protein [Fimbriimonadales bacterium]